MLKKVCSTPECSGEVSSHGKCANCYQRMYYWNDRDLGDKMDHMKKLRIREATMEEITGVRSIESKRRRKAR